MMTITELPVEILENIFLNLLPSDEDKIVEEKAKIKQLLECTEVCKTFNEIIGRSERLMSAIDLRWDEDKDPTPFLMTSRIYRKLVFDKESNPTVFLAHFLRTQPKISTIVMTEKFQLQACEFLTIIDLVKDSLIKLYLWDVHFTGESIPLPIYAPNLQKLGLSGDGEGMENICGLFENSEKLEDFHFYSLPLDSDYFVKIEEFLIDCKRLKKLELDGTVMDQLFETTNFAERASFRLEEINFAWKHSLNPQTLSNLDMFIKKQGCLMELTLKDLLVTDTMLQTIFGLKALKKLKLVSIQFQVAHDIYVRSKSIETLAIIFGYVHQVGNIEWYSSFCKVLKGCPEVRKLILYNVNFNEIAAKCIIQHQKKLEELQLDMRKNVCLINIPTIRTLTIADPKYLKDDQNSKALRFIQHNPQLTRIKFL